MAVFVLDKRKQPLMPCSEKRARQLLQRKRAVVARSQPFTIRLKDRIGGATQPERLAAGAAVSGSVSTGVRAAGPMNAHSGVPASQPRGAKRAHGGP